jgi:hypothetical protein
VQRRKKTPQQDRETFLKIGPLQKYGVLPTNPAHTTQITLRDLAYAHLAHEQANMSKRHLRRYRRFYFFDTSLPQNKGGGVGWGRPAAAAAAKIRSCHNSSSARQGKRDKCSFIRFKVVSLLL